MADKLIELEPGMDHYQEEWEKDGVKAVITHKVKELPMWRLHVNDDETYCNLYASEAMMGDPQYKDIIIREFRKTKQQLKDETD